MHAEKFEEEEEEDEKTESRVTKKKESESNGANVGNYSQFWSDLQSNLKAFSAREREFSNRSKRKYLSYMVCYLYKTKIKEKKSIRFKIFFKS